MDMLDQSELTLPRGMSADMLRDTVLERGVALVKKLRLAEGKEEVNRLIDLNNHLVETEKDIAQLFLGSPKTWTQNQVLEIVVHRSSRMYIVFSSFDCLHQGSPNYGPPTHLDRPSEQCQRHIRK